MLIPLPSAFMLRSIASSQNNHRSSHSRLSIALLASILIGSGNFVFCCQLIHAQQVLGPATPPATEFGLQQSKPGDLPPLGPASPLPGTPLPQDPLPQDPKNSTDPGLPVIPNGIGEPLAAEKLTLDSIKQQKEAAASSELDEETKKKISDVYQAAADRLSRLALLAQKVVELKQRTSTAVARAEALKSSSSLNVEQARFDLDALSLAEAQKEATDTELRLREAKDRITVLTGEQEKLSTRRKELPGLITAAPDRLNELKVQLQAQAPESEPGELTKARKADLQTQIRVLETELPIWAQEREWIEAEFSNDINRLERDTLAAKVVEESKWLTKVNEALNRKRAAVAAKAVVEASQESRAVAAPLQPLADQNKALAEEFAELVTKITTLQGRRNTAAKRLEDLTEKYKQSKTKAKQVGLTDAIGFLLRKQRIELPTLASLRDLQPKDGEINATQLKLLQLDDARSEIPPNGESAKLLFPELAANGPDATAEEGQLLAEARDLLKKKREHLNNLYKSYDTYFDTLVELDTDQHRLINLTRDFRSFIDERVLWIPSSRPIAEQIENLENDRWILAPLVWRESGQLLLLDMAQRSILWAILVFIFIFSQYQALEYRRRITKAGREASSGSCSSFTPTWQALVYTAMISLPWACLLFFISWRMSFQTELLADDVKFKDYFFGIAIGLGATGFALLPLECLRHLCREMGLGSAHFGWSSTTLLPINRLIRLMISLGLPLVFVTSAMYVVDPAFGNDLLERICFIAGAALLTYVVYRLLAPRSGYLRNYYANNAGGWLDRLRYVWFALALFAPVFLATLAIVGYYYTACQLSIRLYTMVCLVIGLLIGRELLARMILVGRRRTYIEQAKQRRAQAASTTSPEESEIAAAALIGNSKEWAAGLSAQTKQSQNLLNSVVLMVAVFGTWFIWADVVPALRVVYQQTLWTTTEIVADTAADGLASDQITTKEIIRNITPTDLLQSIVVLAMTFVVFQNLPGLVDILILNRLPIDASTRNAITAVCSYLVIVLGIIWSAGAIGVHWTQVQWLVTALTFGLAFGLQEIFANFVAGVIILFERPIRVGDVVTIDDVTGIVTKTRARATTIRNWDLKELIVPNKEFITGRVLNWTLSDEVTRLLIPVGVAYGSDTSKTAELLLAAANNHPLVLSDPAPLATFEEFGDSTLNFILRAYVAKLDDRLKTISDLHRIIDNSFKEHRVEIAFPQRDLHIRSIPPQWQSGFNPAPALDADNHSTPVQDKNGPVSQEDSKPN